MCTCMLHIFKNISCEPIGHNIKISTDGTKWGRVNTVYHKSFKARKFHGKLYTQTFAKNFCRIPHTLHMSNMLNLM